MADATANGVGSFKCLLLTPSSSLTLEGWSAGTGRVKWTFAPWRGGLRNLAVWPLYFLDIASIYENYIFGNFLNFFYNLGFNKSGGQASISSRSQVYGGLFDHLKFSVECKIAKI